MRNGLVTWVYAELEGRGWSQAELARRAGISSASVSQVLSHQRPATWDFCAAVARALGVPEDELFVRAGLKRALPAPVAEEREVLRIFRQLPTTLRQAALGMMRGLAREEPPVSRAVADEGTGYEMAEDALVYELLAEFERVPQEWREVALSELKRVRRFAELPRMRVIGEEEDEGERAPAEG